MKVKHSAKESIRLLNLIMAAFTAIAMVLTLCLFLFSPPPEEILRVREEMPNASSAQRAAGINERQSPKEEAKQPQQQNNDAAPIKESVSHKTLSEKQLILELKKKVKGSLVEVNEEGIICFEAANEKSLFVGETAQRSQTFQTRLAAFLPTYLGIIEDYYENDLLEGIRIVSYVSSTFNKAGGSKKGSELSLGRAENILHFLLQHRMYHEMRDKQKFKSMIVPIGYLDQSGERVEIVTVLRSAVEDYALSSLSK